MLRGFLWDEIRSTTELRHSELGWSKRLRTMAGALLEARSRGRLLVTAIYVSVQKHLSPAEFARALLNTEDPWLPEPYPLVAPDTTADCSDYLIGEIDLSEMTPNQVSLTVAPIKSGLANTADTTSVSTAPNKPPARLDDIRTYYEQELTSNMIGDC
jgi:hypothetical protein